MPIDPSIQDLLDRPGKAEAIIASSDTKSLGNILVSLQAAERDSAHPNAASLVNMFSAALNPEPSGPFGNHK